jgi:protoheme ferro-lyase
MPSFNLSGCEWTFSEDAYLSRLPIAIIQSWYQREGYIKSMADLIGEELQKFAKPEEVSSIIEYYA